MYLIVNGYEGVVRGEGPGAALAMHQQRLHLALHHVLLHLHKSIRNDRLARKFRVRVRARVREKDKSPPGDAIIMQYIPSIYLSINLSVSYLGDVVGHVVDDVHVELVGSLAELLRERLPSQEGHAGPVGLSCNGQIVV